MISKVTKDILNESAGNRALQAELEKHHRIKTYFNEKDKTLNTDDKSSFVYSIYDVGGHILKTDEIMLSFIMKHIKNRLQRNEYTSYRSVLLLLCRVIVFWV